MNHLADRLAQQRNEALDREAVTYAELMEARARIEALEAEIAAIQAKPPDGVGVRRPTGA